MLQQTQVDRVIPKYLTFIKKFPTAAELASASQKEVLTLWQGLGYNRRALNLWQSAKIINKKGFPKKEEDLIALPGIGPYTARAVLAFAYNKPAVLIETNIRAVFIHHFFKRTEKVTDKELLPLIEKTLDSKNPREWYWALMDYGSYLKKNIPNPSRKSAHHSKQTKFKGSRRELRGKIVRVLSKEKGIREKKLISLFEHPKEEVGEILGILLAEGLIKRKEGIYSL
jgi:A/G-specific adenine glycosylase